MHEPSTLTFMDIDNQIRVARLTRSAALGDAIGSALASTWLSAERSAIRLENAIARRLAAMTRQESE